jgi:hypothetical protein
LTNSIYNPTRFNYQELQRSNASGSRKYITPDGFSVPSVTTILDATKPQEAKAALQAWKNRVGAKQAQAITTEASGRGTRLHKWLENYVKLGETGDPGTNPYSQQSHNMAHNIIQNGLIKCNEFWGTEVSLYFPEIYAGTTDLVGIHENQEAILDFKQSNREKKEEWITDYFLQVVFYGTAHNEMFGTNIRKGVILMCTKDNKYQEFIIDGKRWDEFTTKMWKRLEEYYSLFI